MNIEIACAIFQLNFLPSNITFIFPCFHSLVRSFSATKAEGFVNSKCIVFLFAIWIANRYYLFSWNRQ